MFVAAKFSDSGVSDGKLQRLPIPPAFFSPVKIASFPLAWAAALVVSVSNLPLHAAESAGAADREYAVSVVARVAGPVLEAAAARRRAAASLGSCRAALCSDSGLSCGSRRAGDVAGGGSASAQQAQQQSGSIMGRANGR